ncbi:hypothetical protein L596_017802 [Steinernema carpocapsae]|uniref:C-type lectin domain-containing protein n=1 Tax=Steinernema carpocapsae TaxID=34508 RepID=A0A4U5N356_STECR|nr:hypothetical protein L596_017802 [Steinernema carpocapsae]
MGIPELLLGLQKTENEWTWTDGSEMDYDKLDEKSKKKTCENKKCRFGSMQLNGRQRFWSYVNYPRSPLLCKYEATWNIL